MLCKKSLHWFSILQVIKDATGARNFLFPPHDVTHNVTNEKAKAREAAIDDNIINEYVAPIQSEIKIHIH